MCVGAGGEEEEEEEACSSTEEEEEEEEDWKKTWAPKYLCGLMTFELRLAFQPT